MINAWVVYSRKAMQDQYRLKKKMYVWFDFNWAGNLLNNTYSLYETMSFDGHLQGAHTCNQGKQASGNYGNNCNCFSLH